MNPTRRAPLRSTALSTLAAWTLCGAAAAQDDPPVLPQPAGDGQVVAPPEAEASGPPIASDGEVATPGRIPTDASDAARARFEKLRGSVSGDAHVRGFELPFYFEQRTPEATRDATIRLRYLDEGPGYVYGAILTEKGNVKQSQMRGPGQGSRPSYWSILKDGTVQSLKGRDFSDSRADLDGWASMAHDLLLITQPTRLRIQRLREIGVERVGERDVPGRTLRIGADVVVFPAVPRDEKARDKDAETLAGRAAQLEWLEVVTPDIRLWREPAGTVRSRRLVLGLAPDTGVPEIALLAPTVTGPLVQPGLNLVHLDRWRVYGESVSRRLPESLRLFELRRAQSVGRTDEERARFDERLQAPFVFATRAPLSLWLLGEDEGGTLDATAYRPESFLPPE